MTSPKRPYEAPIVRVQAFDLGVFGDYGGLETAPYLPVTPPGAGNRRLGMD